MESEVASWYQYKYAVLSIHMEEFNTHKIRHNKLFEVYKPTNPSLAIPTSWKARENVNQLKKSMEKTGKPRGCTLCVCLFVTFVWNQPIRLDTHVYGQMWIVAFDASDSLLSCRTRLVCGGTGKANSTSFYCRTWHPLLEKLAISRYSCACRVIRRQGIGK